MSQPTDTRDIAYEPLPLTTDDHHGLYNAPPSPDPHSSTFHTPQNGPTDLPDEPFIPPGAAQPRFQGHALYDAPLRDSIASSQHTLPRSEYTSSVYALNDPAGQGAFGGSYRDDPRDPYPGDIPMSPVGATGGRMLEEKHAAYTPPRAKSKRKVMIIAVVACALLLLLAIIIPVYFFVIKPGNEKSGNASPSTSGDHSTSLQPTSTGGPKPSVNTVTGGDGSIVTMEDGTKFTYKNSFGGTWYYDEKDPFNNKAQAQSWTPALKDKFTYGTDKIRG